MKCPKCKNIDLAPAKMEQGLSAMGCNQCQGMFVSLLYYRDWAERFAVDADVDGAAPENNDAEVVSIAQEDISDTHNAMSCPKCSRIMTKYRVSSERDNRLDLCGNCDEAWLDKGEWSLLKSLSLATTLPQVFTEQWQRQIRQQVTDDNRRQRYSDSLGEDVVAEADKVREWLKDQPQRAQVLQYLMFE